MYRIALVLVTLMGMTGELFAQKEGKVIINIDPIIQMLQEYRSSAGLGPAALHTGVEESAKPVDRSSATRMRARGFRVQIFSGPNRNDAYAAQSKFKSQFKDYESYISYEEPNYRVKVGDFKSRAEATQFMNVLRSSFQNVFIFTEDIWVYQ